MDYGDHCGANGANLAMNLSQIFGGDGMTEILWLLVLFLGVIVWAFRPRQ